MLDETLRMADEAVRKAANEVDRGAAAMRAARIRYEKSDVKLLKRVGALQIIKIDKYEQEIDDLKTENADLKQQLADVKKSQATNEVNDKIDQLTQDNDELRQQVAAAQQQKDNAMLQVANAVKDRDAWHQKYQVSEQNGATLTGELNRLRGDLDLLANSKTIAQQVSTNPFAQKMWTDVAAMLKLIAAGQVGDALRKRW